MFYLVLFVPLMVPFVAKFWFKREYTIVEMLINLVMAFAITFAVYQLGSFSATQDTEIRSGQVTSKAKTWTSCEHSYQCRCRDVTSCSGSGKSRSCSTSRVCDTCYEHSNDWDWRVKTTLGDLNISRVDRRGDSEPPRFSKVIIGEPAAMEFSYTNYIKAVPDSLFAFSPLLVEKYKNSIPSYPSTFDYYRVNRVLNYTKADTSDWNDIISERLKTLGPSKQVNVVAVLTSKSLDFSEALIYQWAGAKKNDVVMVYGVDPNDNTIQWFQSFSVGNGVENGSLHATLKAMSLGEAVDSKLINMNLDIIKSNFHRVPMEKFEYLKDQIQPPLWVIILSLLLGIGSSVGIAFALSNNNIKERK